jgi:hypothetical protein
MAMHAAGRPARDSLTTTPTMSTAAAKRKMRGVTLLALATILLAGAAGSAQAQESSSQPSAWIDGRVEMPERGVAFTVPVGWVGVDMKADVEQQLAAIAGSLDPELCVECRKTLQVGIDRVTAPGDWLVIMDPASGSACGMAGWQGFDAAVLSEVGDGMAAQLFANPTIADLESPAYLDVPAGSAVRLHMTVADPYRPGLSGLVTTYMVFDGAKRRMVMTSCSALAERPSDDWLSIVETIEWLSEAE